MKFLTVNEELQYSKQKYKTMRKMEDIFLDKGYMQIEPTIFEDYDTVKNFADPDSFVKLISGNEIKVLRPDITTNILRKIIPNINTGESFKLFYDATVFRRKTKGGVRTTREVGVEWIGDGSNSTDQDTLLLALTILDKFSKSYVMEIGNSKFLSYLLKGAEAIDKALLIELIKEKNASELKKKLATITLDQDKLEILSLIFKLEGSIAEIKKVLSNVNIEDDLSTVLDELEILEKAIQSAGYENVQFDLSMVPDWNYYDGVIFQGYIEGSYKEMLKGGRYDTLTEIFGRRTPAIGFMIDLDHLVGIKSEVKE